MAETHIRWTVATEVTCAVPYSCRFCHAKKVATVTSRGTSGTIAAFGIFPSARRSEAIALANEAAEVKAVELARLGECPNCKKTETRDRNAHDSKLWTDVALNAFYGAAWAFTFALVWRPLPPIPLMILGLVFGGVARWRALAWQFDLDAIVRVADDAPAGVKRVVVTPKDEVRSDYTWLVPFGLLALGGTLASRFVGSPRFFSVGFELGTALQVMQSAMALIALFCLGSALFIRWSGAHVASTRDRGFALGAIAAIFGMRSLVNWAQSAIGVQDPNDSRIPFRDLLMPGFLDRSVELDTTAQLVQFAISIGAVAIIGWGLKLHWDGRSTFRQRLRDRMLVVLGLVGFLGYFNFAHLHFGNFVHVWDTYHYVMGAKYFPELGYEKLYDCTTVANYENGRTDEVARQTYTDLKTNIIIKTDDIIANPDRCKSTFTPDRWKAYRQDVAAFRAMVNEGRWREIHLDHGYNATPVWTLAGFVLANSGGPVTLQQLTKLNLFDPLFLTLTVIMIWWAFGPRAFAIAAIVLGCHFPNRYYWTGGAFLRHDWIFWFVASICLLKKQKPTLAGAAFAYTTLLRLFPGLAAAGVAVAAFEYFRQNKKLDTRFIRYVAGGVGATVILVGTSFVFGGPATWQRFAQNTLKHANTPLTNHMGLRTVLSWRPDSIGQKTAGGYRRRLEPEASGTTWKLSSDGDATARAPVEGTYAITVRGYDQSGVATSLDLIVDGVAQGAPIELNSGLQTISRSINLTAGEHQLALALAGSGELGERKPVFEEIELNRITGLDGWWWWKLSRLENWQQAKPLMWLTFILGMIVVWRALKNSGTDPWLGAAMGAGFIVIGAELTNYYYCFLMGLAVLHEKKREVGVILAALCAVSHWLNWGPNPWMSHWLDEQYVTMSLAALIAVFAVWWAFTKNAAYVIAGEESAPLLFNELAPAGVPAPTDLKKKKKK